MLRDPRTWGTLLYLFLMLPLGSFLLHVRVTGIASSLDADRGPDLHVAVSRRLRRHRRTGHESPHPALLPLISVLGDSAADRYAASRQGHRLSSWPARQKIARRDAHRPAKNPPPNSSDPCLPERRGSSRPPPGSRGDAERGRACGSATLAILGAGRGHADPQVEPALKDRPRLKQSPRLLSARKSGTRKSSLTGTAAGRHRRGDPHWSPPGRLRRAWAARGRRATASGSSTRASSTAPPLLIVIGVASLARDNGQPGAQRARQRHGRARGCGRVLLDPGRRQVRARRSAAGTYRWLRQVRYRLTARGYCTQPARAPGVVTARCS